MRNYQSGREDLSNVKDLSSDTVVVFQHKHYLKLAVATNIGLPYILGLIHGDVLGCLLLGGVLRLVLSQHCTYLINSAAHIWGRQPYSKASTARDNPLLALLTYGEGYHNYHHTFQWDYRNGNRWWHYDPTKWLIRSLSIVGLTKELKTCSAARVETAQLETQYLQAAYNCKLLEVSEAWQKCLEDEYNQFVQVLKTWSEHRQEFFEKRKFSSLDKLEKLELLKRNKELSTRLKGHRRRWAQMVGSLGNPALVIS